MKTREEAVAHALSWAGTPYVTGGRIRGAGCDCATIIAEQLLFLGAGAGLSHELAELARYTQDWFLHTSVERYFNELSKYAACIWEGRCMGTPPAKPGDIALYRVAGSKVYNHGSIITAWPRAIHAFDVDRGVSEIRPALYPLTSHAEMAIFDPWQKA